MLDAVHSTFDMICLLLLVYLNLSLFNIVHE